jgi:hypothetical protein
MMEQDGSESLEAIECKYNKKELFGTSRQAALSVTLFRFCKFRVYFLRKNRRTTPSEIGNTVVYFHQEKKRVKAKEKKMSR